MNSQIYENADGQPDIDRILDDAHAGIARLAADRAAIAERRRALVAPRYKTVVAEPREVHNKIALGGVLVNHGLSAIDADALAGLLAFGADQVWSDMDELIDTDPFVTFGLGDNDKMIEFAMVKMALDGDGQLCDITYPIEGVEDPGAPLRPAIVTITGLDDAMLASQRFDEIVLRDQLADVDAIVAFNAAFDARFWRARFPWITQPWICAQRDIDWHAQGYTERSQTALLVAHGFFYEAHRAAPDAWALAILLATQAHDGRTIAANLVDGARRTTHRVRAAGAPFACRDDLKEAGYRWDAKARVWWTDIEPELLDAELAMLEKLHPFIRPTHEPLDWFNRHIA